MTRFTRAKGSKASNERLPNEGTPWHIMKQQLEEALQKEQVPQEKKKSARQLLQEKDDEIYYPQSLGNTNTDWAEFDNPRNKLANNAVKNAQVEEKVKDKKKKSQRNCSEHVASAECTTDQAAEKLEKDTSRKQENNDNTKLEKTLEENLPKKSDSPDSRQFKGKKRKNTVIDEPACENAINNEQEIKPKDSSTKMTKRQKRNKKKQEISNTFNLEGNDWNNSVETGNGRKIDDKQDAKFTPNSPFKDRSRGDNKWSQFEFKNFRRFGNNVPKKFQRKVAKTKDDRGEHGRRKPENNVMKVTINGMDVEIVKYDGFPVKREDAERLKELRQKMVLKGIPKSEIDAAMKLERRKCEKVLARIRRQVCFHCRKAGHNLSDCPELGKEEAGTGICFKCGSTEHTHFECKVTKSDDYRYAKCFICREQGHVAKQCPDNPKGMYPDGGSCKICGDVTHLKKDCPDLTRAAEEASITLDTIKDSNLESLDGSLAARPQEKAPVKKIVKF